MSDDKKPREYWIISPDSGALGIDKEAVVWHRKPVQSIMVSYPVVHVIDYAAYEAEKRRADEAEAETERLRDQFDGDFMGMYTLFHCDLVLKKDTPADILGALAMLTDNNKAEQEIVTIDPHPFLKCDRKRSLFHCASSYFRDNEQGRCYFNKEHYDFGYSWQERYVLRVSSSLKNYNSEIETFCNWIEPFVEYGVAYSRYEESIGPHTYIAKNK